MRVFVTGARGFVGTRLVARLEREGASVVARDVELDVRRAEAVAAELAAAEPDAVIHLAALSFVPSSWGSPEEVYRVNFLGTRSVLAAALRCVPRARVLVVGSSAIYGARSANGEPEPFDESAPLRPISPYAWSKAAADSLAAVYAERGLDVVRVRPFNHTGPGRPDHFVESSLARQLVERELGRSQGPLSLGNLDAVRDFLDVDDVIEAYWRLLDPEVPAGVYNVASGVGRSVREILDRLLTHCDVHPEVKMDPARWRPADAAVGCAARLERATGWKPSISFDDTLARLLTAWRATLRDA